MPFRYGKPEAHQGFEEILRARPGFPRESPSYGIEGESSAEKGQARKMNPNLTRVSIPLLRWTLGLVVMLQSFEFVSSTSAAHFLASSRRLRDHRRGFVLSALHRYHRRLPFARHFRSGCSPAYLAWSVWGRRITCLRRGGDRLDGAREKRNN